MARLLGTLSPDDVKRIAVAALVAALDDGKEKAREKPRLTGLRAVGTGAVLYTAGRAVISGRRFVNERMNGDDEEEFEEDEDFVEDEESEEPEGEADEDFHEDDEVEERSAA